MTRPPGSDASTGLITYIFRKRTATVFSIEKIFDALYARFQESGDPVGRLELPHVSTGLVSVLRNAWFVARHAGKGALHISGDVHYAGIFRPFAKTVITVHDCVVLQRGTGFKRFVMWVIWFWLPLRLASIITVISEKTKAELLETVDLPESKIVVVPNFVDPDLAFESRPFAHECPRILHVGTTPNKNLARVAAALHDVPCVLVIVGQLSDTAAADLEARGIRYENHVGISHSRLRQLYWDADVISFPSTYEGFGMPILEGQAAGRPVLTSDREPMRSIAGKGGALLVNPESVESIRQSLLELLSDESLRRRLIAVGKDNCRRFSLDAVVAGYRAVYRQFGSL